MRHSIFFDFNLPTAATWFYFALMLAIALFFKFNRLLSVRNWDTLTLFLLVPGLLLLMEARQTKDEASRDTLLIAGYSWLLTGSGYFFARCLFDLALVRRPALGPNLNLSGLAWLAGALFLCLGAVAARKPAEADVPVGKTSFVEDQIKKKAADQVQPIAGDERTAQFWIERSIACLCHLSICTALVLIGWRHFHDVTSGMAAATFYVLLPYTAYHIGQIHHVWPTAFLLWAVFAHRKPALAGTLIGLAAGTAFFPVVVLPVWFSFYGRRGSGRFLAFFIAGAALSLGITALALTLAGRPLGPALQGILNLPDWQPWRVPTTEGIWHGTHWAYRLPVFIAYAAFVAVTLIWPGAKNLAHVVALSAANIIGIQFWYADQGGVYVLWYLPLLLLLVFRPNLNDRRPPVINRETDWLHRGWRRLAAALWRLLRPQRPAGVS